MFQKNNVVIGLLPGGIKQFFSANSATKNQSNLDMFSEYENYKSGLIRVNPDTGESLDSIEKISSYFNEADDAAIKFMKDVDAGNIKLKEGESLAQGFARIYGSGIKKLGESFVDLGKKIGLALGEAALSAGIAWLVSTGIQLIAKGAKWLWDEFSGTAEKARQEASLENLNEQSNSYIEQNKNLDNAIEKYNELNDALSKSNITMSETIEYRNQLTDLQKSLIDSYGLEAQGIDLVNGGYKEQLELLEQIRYNKARDYLYDKDEGIAVTDKHGKSDLDRAVEYINGISNDTQVVKSSWISGGYENKSIDEILGFDIEKIVSKYTALSLTKYNDQLILGLNQNSTNKEANEQLTKLIAELNSLYPDNEEVEKFIGKATKIQIDYDAETYEKALSDIRTAVSSKLLLDRQTIEDDARNAVKTYNDALTKYQMDSSDQNKNELDDASKNLAQIQAQVQKYRNENINQLGDLLPYYDELFQNIFEKQNKTVEQKIMDKFINKNVTGSWEAKANQEVNDFIDNLNSEDRSILATLDIDKYKSLEELKIALKEAQSVANSNPIEVKTKYSEQTASLDELEKSFSGLATTYDTTVNLSAKVDASDLEKVNSDMGGVTFNVKDEDVDKINSMSNAIEAYDQTLIKSAGDSEAAQVAADKLATAYVDHSDVLDNLIDHLDDVTEEQKAYVKEQLEVNGIQNAEEVITTRLTKRYKAYSAALVDVSKQMAQYRNDVENVIETGEDSNGVASKMKESVTKMLSTYNDEGVAITTPQIDEKFIVDNLAQIKAATEGDVAAFDELMAKVAELNAMQVFIDANIDEETAAIQAANIMDMVAQANAMDIEVGASIDDSAFLDALNEMISSSQEMADAVSKAFESMGYSVKWNNTKTRAIVPVMHANQGGMLNNQGAGATNLSAMEVSAREMEFSFPGLEITRIGSASGAGAIYGGHTGGSSGGGGGGGGGGGSSSEPTKPKEEAEESFDWIEVAIQRIEEEIARLDKVVGNSYDFWVKRNEALLKEIDKTKDEIKAQQIAYSEYLRNANAVQVNNGKGLNADDYGENDSLVKAQDERLLAEAKKAWATGEYQKKVQEGLMTGKDIETIQNHFLAETIKTYQELYNKAISAQDAVQDLKIKLGDLARTNFDHVKGEAEDAISYFESYADLINARIERTEEKGYFATKTFQGALISYEQERLKVLKKEYDDLIAKRDEATRTKAILPYSEEFNKMNQEILDVGKSIEEATTNLVKFNNEMRQHDWDVFDFTQERINNIAEEFDFLIDLLDNQKLYDDYGLFNSRGWADSALHAGKYNAYMEQALQYAKEREKIEADLKKDNADKNLIERREELIKLQQESITNAYAEKEAVKSLVEEGKYFALIKFV